MSKEAGAESCGRLYSPFPLESYTPIYIGEKGIYIITSFFSYGAARYSLVSTIKELDELRIYSASKAPIYRRSTGALEAL